MTGNFLTACVVGGGNRSSEHVEAMRLDPSLCVAGIHDPHPAPARHWLTQQRVPFYNDLELMLERTRPDFALVSVPHDQHLDVVRKLAARGVHVMKEKPLARTIAEAGDMIETCTACGIDLFVTMQRRFSMMYDGFTRRIERVGAPRKFFAEYTLNTDQPASGWRASKQCAGGGCIIDMGYHMIDVLLWSFGLPAAVCADFDVESLDSVENEARISFIYDSGMIGELFISRSAGPKREFAVLVGEDGVLRVDRQSIVHTNRSGKLIEQVDDSSDWSGLLSRQLSHFVDNLCSSSATRASSANQHLEHVAFVEACYESQRREASVYPVSLLPQAGNEIVAGSLT